MKRKKAKAPPVAAPTLQKVELLLCLREEREGHLVLFAGEEALGLFVPRHEAMDLERLTKMIEERAADMASDLLAGIDL